MAESFIRTIGYAIAQSVRDKQKSILDELGISDKATADSKKLDEHKTGGTTPSDAEKKAGSGGGMQAIDQAKAIELQVSTAELSSISAAGTGIVAGEKNAVAAISRNI